MGEELDEFGIPIKQPEVDEFGIPIKRVDEFGIPVKATVMDHVNAYIGAFNRGVGQVISAPLKFIGAGGNFLQAVATGEDVDPNSGMFTQAGQAVEDFFNEYNPRYENVNQTAQSVAEGVGQGVGMIATAGLGAASRTAQLGEMALSPTLVGATGQALAKVGKTAISPTGFVGGSMTAVPEWEAAKEAGLSDEEAFQTLLKNYLVGQTEAIPIERLMVGLNRITGGKILETVKLMGQQGITEGVQEGIQTYLTNEIARDDYDPDRDPLFQVLESAKVGGIVGLILPGAMSIAQNASPEKRVKLERKLGELQADEAIAEVGDTGDPALNAEIDAEAQIDPVDKQVLEEVKVAEAVQEEQAEVEAEEKLEEDSKYQSELQQYEAEKSKIRSQIETLKNPPVSQGKKATLFDLVGKKIDSEGRVGVVTNVERKGQLYIATFADGSKKPISTEREADDHYLLYQTGLKTVEDKPAKQQDNSGKIKELETKLSSLTPPVRSIKKPDAENTATTAAKPAEIKPSQTPEYKEAVAKVQKLQEQFAALSIEENADQLLFDLREARQALQKIAGKPKDTRKKTALQKQIEDTTGVTKPEKSVTMTPNEAIKHQVQTFFKGVDKGVKKGKALSDELVTKVQEAVKEHPLSDKQVSALLTRIKRTSLYTPGSVSRLNSFIDKVTSDADYADKLNDAKSLNKKLRKLSKTSSSNLQNYKAIARSFASINPEDTFINPHLEMGNKILSALTSPTKEGYAPVNVEEAQDYITDLQDKLAEYEEEQLAKEPDGEKRNLQLFATLRTSLDALNEKDLSEFDESERSTINVLKQLEPSSLTDDQATSIVRVIDNIVENDDFSNAGAVQPIIESKKNLKEITERVKDIGKKEIGFVGKIGANIYQQFTRIFGDSGIAAEIQQKSGIMDVFNAGSRVENQEIKLTKALKEKIKQVNKRYKIKVQDLPNQVRMIIFSELYKNYGDNSHIAKVKSNIERSIAEYEKTDPNTAKAWRDSFAPFSEVNTVEEALAEMKKTNGLYEIWKFFNERFKAEINPRLAKVTNELYNKPYVEAQNYSHTSQTRISDTKTEKDAYAQGNRRGTSKIKPDQSKTSIKANRNLRQGWAYGSDFIEGQLRGYRESLYDIEASRANALVAETIYTPEFEKAVGGSQNAQLIRRMMSRAEEIQQGMSRATANDAVKFLNSATQYIRNLGAIRALASLSQPIKQVPSVWAKAFFNHASTGSIDMFVKGIGAVNMIRTSPELKKLFDQYTIGVRGERLGGIERGDSVGYRLSPGATKTSAKISEWLQRQSDHFGRIVLRPLTQSDVYAARTTWLSYYLQSLKEQGVTKVDLTSEHANQGDPVRKQAAAFAEQMLAETQVPSNPATLAQIIRNENDGGWNFAKNLLIPFSTFSLTNKYRNISDVGKFIRNPNAKNAGAVVGDMFEIMSYSAVAYALLPFYKDWLKSGIEEMFGLEGDDDEEKNIEKKKKSFYTNLINATVPFAIGSPAEAGVAKLSNGLAWMLDNSGASYNEWKKETGGFVYEPEAFDAGVFALGVEPYVEATHGIIDLMSDQASYESFGQTREVDLSPEQTRLLAIKTILDLMGTQGIGEADIYNQIRKIYKEQLRQGSDGSTPNLRLRPRPSIRPTRPTPARNLR